MNDGMAVPVLLASIDRTVLGLAVMMDCLPDPLRRHLLKCEGDLTTCFVCALIERKIFRIAS